MKKVFLPCTALLSQLPYETAAQAGWLKGVWQYLT